MNREGERLIGLRASMLRGTPLSHYLPADSHVTFQAHLQASLSTNEKQRCEVALGNSSTKAPVSVLMDAKLPSLTGGKCARCALIDITEGKKNQEEQLVIANFGIQSAISAIGFADLHGRVTFVNDSFLRLWDTTAPTRCSASISPNSQWRGWTGRVSGQPGRGAATLGGAGQEKRRLSFLCRGSREYRENG